MKRSLGLFVVLAALGMLALPAKSFAFFGVDAGVGIWQQKPSGTFGYQPLANTVGDIDVKDDLNFDKKSRVFVRVRAELPLILPNLYLMVTPMSFDGSGQLTRNISFGGETFNANTTVDSKLKLDHVDLALFYPVPLLKTATAGVLNVDFGLNARQIKFEGTITESLTGQTASKDLTLYVPMVFGAVQLKPIDLFAIEAEFRGIAIGQNHYYDYLGRVKVMPIPFLYIAGGYRSEDIKIDQSDVKAAIKFSGPFAEVGVSF